jgi:hypothetical protein
MRSDRRRALRQTQVEVDHTGKTLGDFVEENDAAKEGVLNTIAGSRNLAYKQLETAEQAIKLVRRCDSK